AEGPDLLRAPPLRARHAHARRHRLLVDVQPAASFDPAVHRRASFSRRRRRSCRSEFALRAQGNSAGCRKLPRHILERTRSTNPLRRLPPAPRERAYHHFHPAWVGQRPMTILVQEPEGRGWMTGEKGYKRP